MQDVAGAYHKLIACSWVCLLLLSSTLTLDSLNFFFKSIACRNVSFDQRSTDNKKDCSILQKILSGLMTIELRWRVCVVQCSMRINFIFLLSALLRLFRPVCSLFRTLKTKQQIIITKTRTSEPFAVPVKCIYPFVSLN